MRIRSNVSAMNTNNCLTRNNSALSKTLEKLSSGYTINRAGDDAAGLAISEKMRALITGLERANSNAQEGINLVQVGEGALSEVHDMLNRVKYLATQSANGTYDNDTDRASLQAELDEITTEIDRIAQNTNFNGIDLFQDKGLEYEMATEATDGADGDTTDTDETIASATKALTLDDVLADESKTLKNIIYTETTFDYTTTQTPGKDNAKTDKTSWGNATAFATELQKTIVPNVVEKILSVYGDAFSYLNGSSIGIGLRLYQDNSSTLASVSSGIGTANGKEYTNYTLSVNVNTLLNGNNIDISDVAKRNALEQTIAHEMIHAFMFEATTSGMHGVDEDFKDITGFPDWFVEGMAQTASGPGNWTRGTSLGLTTSSTPSQIQSALNTNKLGSGTTASQYGTGYLACMYLGYLAAKNAGESIDMTDGADAATKIAKGVSSILKGLKEGNSLNDVIKKATNYKYTKYTEFEEKFASDTDAQQFIQKLLQFTTDNGSDNENTGGGSAERRFKQY